jgi:hypothetical protein
VKHQEGVNRDVLPFLQSIQLLRPRASSLLRTLRLPRHPRITSRHHVALDQVHTQKQIPERLYQKVGLDFERDRFETRTGTGGVKRAFTALPRHLQE